MIIPEKAIEEAARGILSVFVAATDETWARYRTPDAWKQFVPCATAALTYALPFVPGVAITAGDRAILAEQQTEKQP